MGLIITSAFSGLAFAGNDLQSDAEQPYSQIRYLMGTVARIDVWSGDRGQAEAATKAAFEEIAKLESLCSSWRPDSEVSRISKNAGAGWQTVSAPVMEVLEFAKSIAAASDGAYDPTVLPLIEAWGLRGGKKKASIPDGYQLDRALALVGWQRLQLDRDNQVARLGQVGMALDLGGIGKGYALDEAATILEQFEIDGAILDFGGNIRLVGVVPGNKISVVQPDGSDQEFGMIDLAPHQRSVATSGQYERFVGVDGQKFGHIVDPRDGRPVSWLGSVTVIAHNAVTADALSTAVYVMGPEAGLQFVENWNNCEALIIESHDGGQWRARMTSGLERHFKTSSVANSD